jgi:hypothetical protein
MATLNRFNQRITGPARAAQVSPRPAHSAHTQSMIAQANRVPRLANLSAVKSFASGRTKGAKR